MMLVAAAAMTFFACQKQEVNAPEYQSVDCLVFGSEKPSFNDEVKTEWTGETIHWSKGDKIRVAYTCDGVWQNADGSATSDEESGRKTAKLYASDELDAVKEVATFVVPGTFKGDANGKYQFYGIYPSTLTSSTDLKYAPSVAVDIPSVQTPVANSFDVAADVMVAQSDLYEGMPKDGDKNGSISLEWKRLVAHGHITLKTLPVIGQEIVKSIVLTADNEADMVGKHDVNLDTQIVQKVGETATNSITINGTNLTLDDNGNVTFWACFLPCTWTSISIRVETDKATYTLERDLLALEKTKTFVKNARNVLTVNMSEASREVRTSASLPFVKDFSEMSGSTEITSLEGFSDIAGKVYKASGAIRLASASVDGSITTQLLDLSQNFHVKVTASGWDSNEKSLIVSTSDQTENVVLTTYGTSNAVGEFTEHIVNFQPVSNSASVTFKAVKEVRCHIKKIEILEGHASLTPVLTASTPSEISAAGGSGEFAYTLANPIEDKKASAACNVDWITNVSVSDTKVTYTVAENTSEKARVGIITLNYEGAESVNVTVTQAGKAPETGGQVEAQETLTFSSRYSANTVLKGQTVQATNFNVSFAGDGTSAQYYANGTAVRAYAKNTFTVSSNNTIVKVVITFGSSDGSNAITTDVGSYQNGTWTGSSKSVKFTVGGTSGNRRISAITVHYLNSTSGDGNEGVETPDPTPDPEEPSTGVSKTAKITFGSNAVKINAASVTGTDSENNNWTITTVGTTSYTSSSAYYQVGSSSKPATSITFTTTLPAGASVSNVETKFGGFSGTAGNVTLKVGDTSVGTGKLNATSDVVVKSTSTASGNKVTVTVTNIAKGVKCYYISVNYTE